MALRDIRTGEMVALTRALQAQKERLAAYPLTAAFVGVVDETLETLLAAQRVADSATSEEEIEQARALLQRHDSAFDLATRVLSRGLRLLALAFPAQSDAYDFSHDLLFPEGIRIVNSSWRNESGEAALIRSRVESHPETVALLKRSTLNDTPLYAYYEQLVDAGRAIGPLAEQLDAGPTTQERASTEFKARHRWISMVMALRRNVDLAGYSDEDREAVLGGIERLSVERGREKAKEDETDGVVEPVEAEV